MPNLEVTVFNQKLKLTYQVNEKQRLINAVEILNKKWNKFSKMHSKVSHLNIITLISLELQDSIGDYKENVELLKKKIEEQNKDSDNSLKKINNFKSELEYKNREISEIQKVLDEIHNELLQIKTNILKNKNE